MRIWATAAAAIMLAGCATAGGPPTATAIAVPQAADPYFQAGALRAQQGPSSARARNVILFIGDGMGVSTVTAARIFAGQRLGRDGESYDLTLDAFPHTALSRTYSHDLQISESASTATAIVSGVKTRGGGVGLQSAARLNECGDTAGNISMSLFEMAEAQGLATGIVSTARITHATPASAYAHVVNRDWENDATVARANGAPCADIARQLIEWPAGDGFEIALGGGRANFLPRTTTDPETPTVSGQRADGRDLTAEWAARPGRVFVWNTAQLEAAPADADVLGLFAPSHMAYEVERAADVAGEPSLEQMTTIAIARLSQNPNGYVLMVEAGRIDHAHHEGKAHKALADAVAFDDAIRAALAQTSREDTLILVTADHSHTLTIAGYAQRGTPILGLSTSPDGDGLALAGDGRPYTTLGYANGPGSVYADGQGGAEGRADLRSVDTTAPDYRQQALVPLGSETHGGEDVAIYAWGPGDENVAGTLEQNVIFHILARALGIAPQ
ncbi:MAG: alkaline phosphatase [Hyphomonadaceae bacterium]|nr:alkaline phosphatase [Hyphomonadaceae bacterium]